MAIVRELPPVMQIAFNPDGTAMVSVSANGMIVWDTTTWSVLLLINGGSGYDAGEIALGTGYLAASGGVESGVQIYNYRVLTEAPALLATTSPITSMAFSPLDHLLVTADTSNQMQIWDARNNVLLSSSGGGNTIQQVEFSPAGDAIFTLDTNGLVSVWTTSP